MLIKTTVKLYKMSTGLKITEFTITGIIVVMLCNVML